MKRTLLIAGAVAGSLLMIRAFLSVISTAIPVEPRAGVRNVSVGGVSIISDPVVIGFTSVSTPASAAVFLVGAVITVLCIAKLTREPRGVPPPLPTDLH